MARQGFTFLVGTNFYFFIQKVMLAGVEVAEIQKGVQDGQERRRWRGQCEADNRLKGDFLQPSTTPEGTLSSLPELDRNSIDPDWIDTGALNTRKMCLRGCEDSQAKRSSNNPHIISYTLTWHFVMLNI